MSELHSGTHPINNVQQMQKIKCTPVRIFTAWPFSAYCHSLWMPSVLRTSLFAVSWGNVCLVRARRATFLFTIPT